jgi:protein-ribulosamine 3-kinase
MKRMLELEEIAQGPSEELDQLLVPLYEKVIPRLLRPLEIGGRQVQPCLVHGDLWYGNALMDLATDKPITFDACAFWAHNECECIESSSTKTQSRIAKAITEMMTIDELGTWRPVRYKIGRPYMKEYHKNFPISPPEKDWEDRNALYAM